MAFDLKIIESINDIESLQRLLTEEQQAREALEDRIRQVTAEYKKLEIELFRYRDHFETAVARRTAELMTANERLLHEDRQRRLVARERSRIKDQFNEATLLLETILDAIPDIIGVQDGNHRLLRLNKAGYRFFGIQEGPSHITRCFELIGQKAPCDQCVTMQILNTQQPAQMEKYIDAKTVWMDVRAYPIFDMDGRVFRIVEHWRDITLLKQSAASLIESEEKYRLLVENANEAIFIFQDDGFKFSNRKAREMARKLNLAGDRKPLVDFIHAGDRDLVAADKVMRRLNGLESTSFPLVFRLVNARGDWIWVELNTVNIKWHGHRATLNFLRDVTYNKNLERQLHEAQRMEAIGTLAGGIAHDFNNLLMGIQGNVSLMYLDQAATPEISEKLKSIENCVESGSRLTKQLLGFARGGKYVVKSIDMSQVVKDAAELFSRTRKDIKIHGSYEKQLWTVAGDASQLEQVMLNLYLNAWQAMQKNGDLYLKTDNVELDTYFVKPFQVPPGRYVRIAITDTGIGMDETVRRRIFDPFFTTHKPGRGTGLGLASVFGIIRNHRGIITVGSKLGEGSTFTIYLPASDRPPEAEVIIPTTVAAGHETILLVDDEDQILEVAQLMLENLGYTVLPANGGQCGVDIFTRSQQSIDLVVLDMVMPDMDGEAVFRQIRSQVPEVKVLFISGHSFSGRQRKLLNSGNCDFLQKPFKLPQFSAKIRHVLESHTLPG